MKILKHTSPDALAIFVRGHLPPTLRMEEIPFGYGYIFAIYRREYRRNILQKAFDVKGDVIATVGTNSVTLYHPEYFSDISDCISLFEEAHRIEITLEYWES